MKRNHLLFVTVAILLLSATVFLVVYREVITARLNSLERRADLLPAAIAPLRFTILNRADDFISARITFLDPAGKEIRTTERTWNGYQLIFQVRELRLGDRVLFFPSRIGTDVLPASYPVFEFYNFAGFPEIYRRESMRDKEIREYSAALTAARSPWFLYSSKKRLSTVSASISEYENEASYLLLCSVDGKVSIEKE